MASIGERPCAMIEDQFIDLIDPLLREVGSGFVGGEEFRDPPLDVLRYYRRVLRLFGLPLFGKAQSIVTVVRQPVDVDGTKAGYERLVKRLALAASGRFPPWRGPVIGLTALVLTPEPIGPGDDAMLREVLDVKLRRMRVVPFGLFRINLGQEAVSLAIHTDSDGLFTEPGVLADALCAGFRRFVPLIEI
jgi:hypothetical protein